jgi:hypothetical protein
LLSVLSNLPLTAQLYLQNFSFLILGIHSAVNPIIYAFKAAQFKEELRHINDRAILQCISLLLKIRPESLRSSVGSIVNTPTIHKTFSEGDSQKTGKIDIELKSLNNTTSRVDSEIPI